MNDDLAALATELRALIAKWGIEAARAAFEQHADALSAAQREQLAVLAFGSGNSFSGPVNVGDVAGGNVTKGNADVPGTVQGAVVGVNQGTVQVAIAAPVSRSLEDYLAALDRLATLYMAAKEAPRTLGWLAETEVFAHARAELNNEILDDLRVPIARAVLAWSLPADDTMLTLDAVRQSLVAAALLPLVRGTTLDKVYDQKWEEGPPLVGSCPAGAAACGALDMAGNVWEATASSYKGYPAQSAVEIKDFTSDDGDVPWRGGSWWNNRTYVR